MSVVILLLGSLLPGYAIPTAAVAGLVTAAAVLHSGCPAGFAVYAVSSVLSLLLLPQKIAALWYLLVFGHYGSVKSLLERMPGRWMEWASKCLVYTAAFFMMKVMFRNAFSALTALLPLSVLPLYAVGLAVFLLYDIGLSRFISLYLRRMRRNSQ